MTFPRPRFSLRTLLILITVGTVLCWGYFIGIPRWKIYREREGFLNTAKTIKVGMPTETAMKIALQLGGRCIIDHQDSTFCYVFREDIYGIHILSTGSRSSGTVHTVKLFHLGSPPEGYATMEKFTLRAYRTENFSGFKLIYSDPLLK